MTEIRPPVVFIHGLWLHSTLLAAVDRAVHRARLLVFRTGMAG